MKTKFKFLLFAAAATTAGFTSCSSDDDSDGGVNGPDTRFSLTISAPKTYADANASADGKEVELKTVDVFIFKSSGAFEGHSTLASTDFDVASGVWTLKDAKRIKTTTGKKNIYVGMNLPTAIATAIETSGASAVQEITLLSELTGNGLAMFSTTVNSEELKIEESGHKNIVNAKVSRLVSKVIFYSDEASYTVKGIGGTAEDLMFTAGNVNNEFYPLPTADFKDPNFTAADLSGDFLHPSRTPAQVDDYVAINTVTPVVAVKDANKVYAMENSIADGPLQGSATYGVVRTIYTPIKATTYATPGDASSSMVDGTFTKGDSFWLVKSASGNIYFANATDAEAYVTDNGGDITKDIKEYTDGKMYYAVFFKEDTPKAPASKYSIFRNTIYQVTVTGINGLGSNTDQPGDKDNPGIIDPEEPIEESDPTDITVVVSIEDWSLVASQNEELEGK